MQNVSARLLQLGHHRLGRFGADDQVQLCGFKCGWCRDEGRPWPEVPRCRSYPEVGAYAADMLAAIANGCCPVIACIPQPSTLNVGFLASLYKELTARAPFLGGATGTLAHVALHWSEAARDLHHPEDAPLAAHETNGRSVYWQGLRGVFEMLHRSHLLVDMLFDSQLSASDLAPYGVLVLSNSACLSARQCEAVQAWVAAGGLLVATAQTSMLDGEGRPYSDGGALAVAHFGLAQVLGVEVDAAAAADGSVAPEAPDSSVARHSLRASPTAATGGVLRRS
eukprot:SAG11_NODE_5950_length_1426_cov_1.836473_1_plen_281_part_00